MLILSGLSKIYVFLHIYIFIISQKHYLALYFLIASDKNSIQKIFFVFVIFALKRVVDTLLELPLWGRSKEYQETFWYTK